MTGNLPVPSLHPSGAGKDVRPGCRPYIQVFKGDALLFTSAAAAGLPAWVRLLLPLLPLPTYP